MAYDTDLFITREHITEVIKYDMGPKTLADMGGFKYFGANISGFNVQGDVALA